METENKVTVTNEMRDYAHRFFQKAFEDNGKMYESLDDWDSYGDNVDLNAYFYDQFIGVSAYSVVDGETDTASMTNVFRFYVGENPDDPLHAIPLGDDEYIDLKNGQAHLTPANVLLMSRAIDVHELEDEYSLDHIVWLIGMLEDALEEALKVGETK